MRSAFTCDEGRNESRVCGILRALPVMQDSKKKLSVMRWKFTCDENRNERRDYVTICRLTCDERRDERSSVKLDGSVVVTSKISVILT